MWEKLEPLVQPLVSLLARGVGALVLVVVVAIVYFVAQRAIGRLKTKGTVPERVEESLLRILRAAALTVGLLLVLQQFALLEYAWTTLSALLAMIAIGFVAMWSVLSNYLCALILLVSRPFNEGDNIEIVNENVRGEVIRVNLLFTTIRDADDSGRFIQVPNNMFFQKIIRRQSSAPSAQA